MPKVIKDLERRLIEEARRQIEESGYGAMTIRSVAKACGVGVGTVYNYFPSKDALLATYMLEDWKRCLGAIETVSMGSETPRAVVRCIYEQLLAYADLHKMIFQDETAAAGFAGSFGQYHALLRSQLASFLRRFVESGFAAEFIAESLLTWTMAGRNFDEIYDVIAKIF